MKTYYKMVGCPPNAVIISKDKAIKEAIEHAQSRIRIAKNELVGVISYIQQFEVFHNTEEALQETIGDLIETEHIMDNYITK